MTGEPSRKRNLVTDDVVNLAEQRPVKRAKTKSADSYKAVDENEEASVEILEEDINLGSNAASDSDVDIRHIGAAIVRDAVIKLDAFWRMTDIKYDGKLIRYSFIIPVLTQL